jgi:hypothetical protein
MTCLHPSERIEGTSAECAHLHLLLTCFRASPPPMRLPEVTGCPLPDLLGAGPTRNLGILMEGATDAEATAIARQTAESCGIVVEDPELGMTSLALADATGTLTASRIEAALSSDHAYARSLAQFDRAVTIRYRAVLAGSYGEWGPDAERVMDQGRQAVPALTASGRQFGAIVRGARTAQGLTLAELGHRTGYSAAQVSRYERGLAPLTDIAVLRRFADGHP